ncbi:hypothetical protein ABZ920_30180 [Streptomyces sp. NPDC046831]|uniref:hypothetical protein n=1 Tax=Streptomyces sp. NPDC046831 TaxID=3154805 RepID=UPI0033E9D02E
MSADEVLGTGGAAAARESTGPRHAAPRKPLFTRFHVPPGKAIAMAAMPTAVLMAMGFTPTLALADNNPTAPSSNSLSAEEYKDCVAALEGSGDEASASPSPSASASATGEDDGKDGGKDPAEPEPSTSPATREPSGDRTSGASSSDSGSDDEASRSSSSGSGAPSGGSGPTAGTSGTGGGDTASPSPSPSQDDTSGGLLGTVGDALTDLVTGGLEPGAQSGTSAPADPAPSASPSATASPDAPSDSADRPATDPAGHTADKATGTAEDTAKDTTTDAAEDAGDKAADGTAGTAGDSADEATASPSPSASATTDAADCPAATDAEGGVDNRILVPDDPWELQASSLLLKGAQYKGIVEVRTASGATKKVLKYVVTDGTDIGDLHQLVKDRKSGKTYHVQAAKGSTSTISDGDTVMYTESISGNLLGLIPVTFSPDSPPPLDIPLIYFTKVKVVQAGQFGGTLHIPGLHQFTSD